MSLVVLWVSAGKNRRQRKDGRNVVLLAGVVNLRIKKKGIKAEDEAV